MRFRSVSPFVNAVLRQAQRDQRHLLERLSRQPIGIWASHPDLLIARWEKRWGIKKMESLCAWNNQAPNVTIRVNVNKISSADFRDLTARQGLSFEPHPFRPDEFLVVSSGVHVVRYTGIRAGLFLHSGSRHISCDRALLDSRPGETILDACAAPGGKTFMIAERIGPTGSIVAIEGNAERLSRLRENIKRMDQPHINLEHADAASWSGASTDAGLNLGIVCIPFT